MMGNGRGDGAAVGARWCEAAALVAGATRWSGIPRVARSELRRLARAAGALGETSTDAAILARKTGVTSQSIASVRRRSRRIREKIIGHGWGVRAPQIGVVQGIRALDGGGALLHEPASEHGRGVFFQPLIHQRGHLFAEIGGVRQAREFVALQRVFRCGKQELPRRLGRVAGQGGPPREAGCCKTNRTVIHVKVNDRV